MDGRANLEGGQARQRRAIPLRRVALLVAVLLAIGAGWLLLLTRDFDAFAFLDAHHEALTAWRDRYLVAAAALYMLVYVAVVALSLPLNFAMTLAGGFLFGFLGGTLLAVVAVTAGATVVFLVAKASFGDRLRRRILQQGSSQLFERLDRGFRDSAIVYLVALRLVPTLPSIFINAAPAFFGVRACTFAAATLVGVVPSTVVTAWFGASLSQALAEGEPAVRMPAYDPYAIGAVLVGLVVLAAAPILLKRLRQ